jgi:hypothetical protein
MPPSRKEPSSNRAPGHHPKQPRASALHERELKEEKIKDAERIELAPLEEEDREEKIERSLEAIYVDARGRVPDLSRLTRKRSSTIGRVAVGLCVFALIAAGVAWAGLLYAPSWFQGAPVAKAMAVEVKTPPTITLGKEEMFEVEWRNESVSSVLQSDVRLSWPAEFTPTSFHPAPTDPSAKRWALGLLPVGSKGVITVKGVFTGSLGGHGSIQVITTYRRGPAERDEELVVSQPVAYGASVLEGTLEVPEKVVAGDNVTLHYRIRNQGKIPLKGLLVRFSLPERFLLSRPSSGVEGEDVFSLGDLAAGASTTFVAVGSFPSDLSGEMPIQAEVGQRSGEGAFLALQRNRATVPVLAGDLALRLVVNGGTGERNVRPGEPISVALGYENTSAETLKGTTVTLRFESFINGKSTTGTSLLQWTALDDPAGGATNTRARIQTLTYDAKRLRALEVLLPQGQGSLEASLPTLMVASGTKEATIVVSAVAQVPTIGNATVNRTVKAQPVTIRYRSDAELSAEARYYTEEGIPLGSGPLPPVVGKATAYRVVWRVKKTLHSLDQMQLRAVLPASVTWTERATAEAGSVTYDPTSRTVTWKLLHLPESVKEVEATFEIQITPNAADAGRFAALLGETLLEARDPLVQALIVQTKPPLNTDLQDDEGAKGKGVVRKE